MSPTKGVVSVGGIDNYKHAAELADTFADVGINDLFIEDSIYWRWRSWQMGSGDEFTPFELEKFGCADEMIRRRSPATPTSGLVVKTAKDRLRTISLTPASEITPRKVHWLWKPLVPRGALTLLAGMPGVGKSLIALDFAARVTRGESEMQSGKPRTVLVYSTEDARAQVIVPRLMATGADLSLVQFIDVSEADVHGVEVGAALTLPIDQEELALAIEAYSALLVVFDPLMSVLDPSKSTNNDRELRTALEPLAATLDRTKAAGIGLAHYRKAKGSAADMVMGGRGFVGVARSVLATAKDNETGEMVMSVVKSNYGGMGTPGDRYQVVTELVEVIGDDGKPEEVETPLIEWLGATEDAGEDVIEELLDSGSSRSGAKARERAADWLLEFMRRSGGAAWYEQVEAGFAEAGLKYPTVNRARQDIGIETTRSQIEKGKTIWTMPDVDPMPFVTGVVVVSTAGADLVASTTPPTAPSVLDGQR